VRESEIDVGDGGVREVGDLSVQSTNLPPPSPRPRLETNTTTTHHLSLLGHLFDLRNRLLLLILQRHALAVELADRLVEHALVLPQDFCRRLALAEEPVHGC